MASPQPFTVAIPDSALEHLQARLALTRLPPELSGAGRTRGPPRAEIERLVARWRGGWDWRAREHAINTLPMFTLPLPVAGFGDMRLHFVHARAAAPGAIPLLYLHGWPGHFLEVEHMLPLLDDPSGKHPSFHVVAPSLPGFGFSDAPEKTGFGLVQFAEICHKLMLALGYDQYVTQGGDLGRRIGRLLAVQHGGTSVKAAHTNYPEGFPINPLKHPLYWLQDLLARFSPVERVRAARQAWYTSDGYGYFAQHSTRPQTLAYALQDSPAGLLAWVLEKLAEWSDPGRAWGDDEVLDWAALYWLAPAGPGATLHNYYERAHESVPELEEYVRVPYGVSFFPQEIQQPSLPRIYAAHNVVFSAEHEKGGHFAQHEVPEALVGDLRRMFGRGGPAFGVVPGQTGY